MKWTVGAKIAAGFSLTLAVFVIVGITSYRGTSQLEATTEARRQAFQLLAARDRMLTSARAAGQVLRTYIITGAGEDLEEFERYRIRAEESLQVLRKQQSAELKPLVDKLSLLFRDYLGTSTRLAETRRDSGLAVAADLLVSGQTRQTLEGFYSALEDVGRVEEAVLKEQIARSLEDADEARWIILFGTLAAIVLAGVAGLLITRDISRPLRQLTMAAERITVGDLSGGVSHQDRSDEIGLLARSLQRMTQSLQGMAATAGLIAAGDLRATVEPLSPADVVGNAFAKMSHDLRLQIRELMEGAGVLGSAANEIAGSTSQLAASASQSAAAVSETTTTVEEVRQTAQLASEKARNVSESAQKAVQVSESGRTATSTVEAGISRIRLQMEAIASSMMRLSEQGQAIGQIIATVEDLSVQSNLLAVNAAIEAAKAGEHGRGFSVVAQEVKGLAEQSRQATNQVRSILGDIQRATSEAVLATEEGAKAVDAGVRQTELAGGAIQVMSASVNDAAQAAMQIAASSQQQLIGMDQVANAMGSIKQASVQNLESASKLEEAARSISDLGQKLRVLIERYRV